MKDNEYLSKILIAIALALCFFVPFGITYAIEINDAKNVPSTVETTTSAEVTTQPDKSEKDESKSEIETKKTEEYSDLMVELSTKKARRSVADKNESKEVPNTSSTSPKTVNEKPTETTRSEKTDTVGEITKEEVADSQPKDEIPPEPETETEPEKTTKVVSNRGKVSISKSEYEYICCLVYGEAGNEPYEGQVLVAQCFYNAMEESGKNAFQTKAKYRYYGSTSNGTSESCRKAVSAVFYDGYRATDAKVLYFYDPVWWNNHHPGEDAWHESQRFVCQVGGHKFFAKK